jgi:hypothetical protein
LAAIVPHSNQRVRSSKPAKPAQIATGVWDELSSQAKAALPDRGSTAFERV